MVMWHRVTTGVRSRAAAICTVKFRPLCLTKRLRRLCRGLEWGCGERIELKIEVQFLVAFGFSDQKPTPLLPQDPVCPAWGFRTAGRPEQRASRSRRHWQIKVRVTRKQDNYEDEVVGRVVNSKVTCVSTMTLIFDSLNFIWIVPPKAKNSNMSVGTPSRQAILSLYHNMLRTSQSFSSYNFREYFVRRTKDTFHTMQVRSFFITLCINLFKVIPSFYFALPFSNVTN